MDPSSVSSSVPQSPLTRRPRPPSASSSSNALHKGQSQTQGEGQPLVPTSSSSINTSFKPPLPTSSNPGSTRSSRANSVVNTQKRDELPSDGIQTTYSGDAHGSNHNSHNSRDSSNPKSPTSPHPASKSRKHQRTKSRDTTSPVGSTEQVLEDREFVPLKDKNQRSLDNVRPTLTQKENRRSSSKLNSRLSSMYSFTSLSNVAEPPGVPKGKTYSRKGVIQVSSPLSKDEFVAVRVDEILDAHGNPLAAPKKANTKSKKNDPSRLQSLTDVVRSNDSLASDASHTGGMSPGDVIFAIEDQPVIEDPSQPKPIFVQDFDRFRYFSSETEQVTRYDTNPFIPMTTWEDDLKSLGEKIENQTRQIFLLLGGILAGISILTFILFPLTKDIPSNVNSDITFAQGVDSVQVVGYVISIPLATLTQQISSTLTSPVVHFLSLYSPNALVVNYVLHFLVTCLLWNAIQTVLPKPTTYFDAGLSQGTSSSRYLTSSPKERHVPSGMHHRRAHSAREMTSSVPVRTTRQQSILKLLGSSIDTMLEIPSTKSSTSSYPKKQSPGPNKGSFFQWTFFICALIAFLSHVILLRLDYHLFTSTSDPYGAGIYGSSPLWMYTVNTTSPFIADFQQWKKLTMVRGTFALVAFVLRCWI